ncbi:MAG: right-handed parallel beta-helix repeat-containing protein, partial [Bacteroidetes bacterium]|nr:right-handed parallel beta-helix repeat-containing protein [Bacteroidota bacterium]
EALQYGILYTNSEDYVPAIIVHKGKSYEAEIRLKGDGVDHLEHKVKWSYKVKLKKGSTLWGMRKFSIQHPKSRNYVYEWIYQKALAREGIMSLRYSFCSADLEILDGEEKGIVPLGIYAIEESFTDYLIENNKRKKGVILKFDEEMRWLESGESLQLGPGSEYIDRRLMKEGYSIVFGEKKVLENDNLNSQFEIAKNLLEGYRKDELAVSEVFDIRRLAKFTAISNLMGATHCLASHNLRFYYNPISNKLEPIGFDGDAGETLTQPMYYFKTGVDEDFLPHFLKATKEVTSSAYLDALFEDLDIDIRACDYFLRSEFNNNAFDKNIITKNAAVLSTRSEPKTVLTCYLNSAPKDYAVIGIKNFVRFPVEILSLEGRDSEIKIQPDEESNLIRSYKKEMVYFKLVGEGIGEKLYSLAKAEKLRIKYRLAGSEKERFIKVLPYSEYDKEIATEIIKKTEPNFGDVDFLIVNEPDKTITFKTGKRKLSNKLIIPSGYRVIAREGLKLNIEKGAFIISNSPIEFLGKADKPIKIYSKNGDGKGILVIGAEGKSILNFTIFDGISSQKTKLWKMTGALNFYESEVAINQIKFNDIQCEDALSIVRSKFSIENAKFTNLKSDAFDIDFSEGVIKNSVISQLGGDGLDLTKSKIKLSNISISEGGKYGLRCKRETTVSGEKIEISNCKAGIVSTDLSNVTLDDVVIQNCKIETAAYQTKSEFGPATITLKQAKMTALEGANIIENDSRLIVNDKAMPTIPNVIDKLKTLK